MSSEKKVTQNLCPAAKVHFATLKTFPVFLILQSRFPLTSIKWMGWMMGKRMIKGAANIYCSCQIEENGEIRAFSDGVRWTKLEE